MRKYINTQQPNADQQMRALAKRGYVAVEIVGVTLVMARPQVERSKARKAARNGKRENMRLAMEIE